MSFLVFVHQNFRPTAVIQKIIGINDGNFAASLESGIEAFESERTRTFDEFPQWICATGTKLIIPW